MKKDYHISDTCMVCKFCLIQREYQINETNYYCNLDDTYWEKCHEVKNWAKILEWKASHLVSSSGNCNSFSSGRYFLSVS